jgi:hypothetical protein
MTQREAGRLAVVHDGRRAMFLFERRLMSKKDYVAMAELIRKELELCDTHEQVCVVEAMRDRIAIMFADNNPRFDVDRFKEACEL